MHRVRGFAIFALIGVAFTMAAGAATKVHVITFGKWTPVQWLRFDAEPLTIKVRPLVVDGRIRENTVGASHDITERLFAVRRAYRVNDGLPVDSAPHWQWERGGWLLVDRMTGRISPINLPEFDAYYSSASWYRDYVAYCGVADDGKKTYAIVAQISRRKPVLKKALANDGISDDAAPDSACPAPSWQRNPVRVSFEFAGSAKQTFAIRGHLVDVVSEADEEDEGR